MTREVNEMTELLENNNLTLFLNDAQSYIGSIPQRINDYANESIYDVIGPGGTFENIRGTIEEVLDGIKDNIGHLNYTLPLAEARNSVQDFTDNVDYWEVNFEQFNSNADGWSSFSLLEPFTLGQNLRKKSDYWSN